METETEQLESAWVTRAVSRMGMELRDSDCDWDSGSAAKAKAESGQLYSMPKPFAKLNEQLEWAWAAAGQ